MTLKKTAENTIRHILMDIFKDVVHYSDVDVTKEKRRKMKMLITNEMVLRLAHLIDEYVKIKIEDDEQSRSLPVVRQGKKVKI